MKNKPVNLLFASSLALLLNACGGGGGDGTGTISLNITDAPVDNATKVVVAFSGVTLKSADGDDIVFPEEGAPEGEWPKTIDLLALQGTLSEPLLDSVEIPAGDYSQIRLHVNAEFDSELDSYIEFEDGTQVELRVPSGSQSGLKLNTPFSVDDSTAEAVYTIDFDLRKSIVDPRGQPGYFLKPVLRLVQNTDIGSIAGTVHADLLSEAAGCSDTDVDSHNWVYAYVGSGAVVDDVGSENEPVTSAMVSYDMDGEVYRYELGYLHEGEYTIAFTCSADNDDNETDDDENTIFSGLVHNVTVEAGVQTVQDFEPPSP